MKKMARLVSYKKRDENRYSTFNDETSNNSSENLTEKNRIRLLPKKKPKTKTKKTAKTSNKMPETMPTISASIEMHRNKIAQSRTINASSGCSGITQGRRRGLPLHQQHHRAQSRFNCCFNSTFCARKCNWRCNRSAGTNNDSNTNCWRTIFCCWCWCWKWCCRRKCCARICCGCIDYEDKEYDDDDDDIDAKFEQYKYEMSLNELKRECCDTVNEEQETSFQSNLYRIDALPSTIANTDHKTYDECTAINDAGKTSTKTTSKIFRYRKYWNWNDSLRSNSDKFLETLEYDMTDGEQSLQRSNNKYNRTDVSATTKGYIPDLHVWVSFAIERHWIRTSLHATKCAWLRQFFCNLLFIRCMSDTCIFLWVATIGSHFPISISFNTRHFLWIFRCICARCTEKEIEMIVVAIRFEQAWQIRFIYKILNAMNVVY